MKGLAPATIKQLMDDVVLNNSSAVYTVDISQIAPNGFFGLELSVSGSGAPSLNVTLSFSISGENYIAPTGMTVSVVTAFVKTSGVGANGKDLYDITSLIPPCKEIRITVTETASANGTTNLWLLTA